MTEKKARELVEEGQRISAAWRDKMRPESDRLTRIIVREETKEMRQETDLLRADLKELVKNINQEIDLLRADLKVMFERLGKD